MSRRHLLVILACVAAATSIHELSYSSTRQRRRRRRRRRRVHGQEQSVWQANFTCLLLVSSKSGAFQLCLLSLSLPLLTLNHAAAATSGRPQRSLISTRGDPRLRLAGAARLERANELTNGHQSYLQQEPNTAQRHAIRRWLNNFPKREKERERASEQASERALLFVGLPACLPSRSGSVSARV